MIAFVVEGLLSEPSMIRTEVTLQLESYTIYSISTNLLVPLIHEVGLDQDKALLHILDMVSDRIESFA